MAVSPESPFQGAHSRDVYLRRRALAAAAAVVALALLVWALSGLGRASTIQPRAVSGSSGVLAPPPWEASGATGLPSPADQNAAVARFADLGLPLYCGGGRGRYVALTFDDGPGLGTTELLTRLHGAGARATFFLIGRQVGKYAPLVRAERDAGTVGDHTFNHPFLTHADPVVREFEVAHTQLLLRDLLGDPITLFRPPYEAHNPAIDRLVKRKGMLTVLWDVDSRDSAHADAAQVAYNVDSGLRPGSIVLMHEHYPTTQAALPKILTTLARRGLRSVTIPELLALDPPTPAQLRAGFRGCEAARSGARSAAPGGA
jgi:peptidoglycan/xylan/chitin deacetylase (PgdA/CDA1 family)